MFLLINYSTVALTSFALAVNIQCNTCEKDIKTWPEKIPGVDSVALDADQGKMTISDNVDPQSVIQTSESIRQNQNFLREKILPTNKANDMQMVTKKKPPAGKIDQNM
ncbi:hypothetical protein RJ639_023464, partial [Escallonia herrerae]